MCDNRLPPDDYIKEIYIYSVEASNNGQKTIPAYIFPTKLEGQSYDSLKSVFKDNIKYLSFWENLKEGYDKFKNTKEVLKFEINPEGRYIF